MNCRECKNLLIEYAEGLLDGHPKEGVEQHLEQCPQCRKEIENIRLLEDRILQNSLSFRSIDLEESIMDRIAGERSIRLKAAGSAGFFHQIRSLFMKNAVLKIASAAAVLGREVSRRRVLADGDGHRIAGTEPRVPVARPPYGARARGGGCAPRPVRLRRRGSPRRLARRADDHRPTAEDHFAGAGGRDAKDRAGEFASPRSWWTQGTGSTSGVTRTTARPETCSRFRTRSRWCWRPRWWRQWQRSE